MPSDPVGGGCGCVLLGLILIIFGLYLVFLAVMEWLIQSGLAYPVAAGVVAWVVVAAWIAIRHRRQEGARDASQGTTPHS